MGDEELLDGGNMNGGVVRVGDTVRRSAGPWAPSVHRLLTHVAGRGFDVPEPQGLDALGRESLSFIPGSTAHPHHPELFREPAALRRVGRMIANFHDAQHGFIAHEADTWRDEGRDPTGPAELIAHNDLAPWNLVVDGDRWVFIDWDLAAPGRRLWDVAWAVQSFADLWPDTVADDEIAAARIAAFCEGAGLADGRRDELLAVVVERTSTHAADLRARAAGGDPRCARLVSEGHADRWELAADFVSDRWRRWRSP